ncbi:hypothetical protein CFBP6625_16020 [Agrobacterium tumefaciens]|nr:hypothetical protein CFBP6625_16020 [Agrobacterium tumefaciens]
MRLHIQLRHSGLEPESSRRASALRETPFSPRTWDGWIPAQGRNDGKLGAFVNAAPLASDYPSSLPVILRYPCHRTCGSWSRRA